MLEFPTVSVPLALSAHQQAKQFHRYHADPVKAKQVYLNTLAVYAAQVYLEWHGIGSDWENSESFDPVMQGLMDIADLTVPNLGKLECRVVLPNAERVSIPEEVWQDRIGYLMIQVNDSLREATVLGFLTQVEEREISITEVRSLDEFIPYLNQLQSQSLPSQVESQITSLSQWFNRVIDRSWESLETFFNTSPAELSFSFRKRDDLELKRGKRLNVFPTPVVLGVSLTESQAETDLLAEIDISVGLYPDSGQTQLPENLQLLILDENGRVVMQSEAGNSESLEFQFSGVVGERFSVKVILDSIIFIEKFII